MGRGSSLVEGGKNAQSRGNGEAVEGVGPNDSWEERITVSMEVDAADQDPRMHSLVQPRLSNFA